MQISQKSKIVAVVAASIMALSSAAYAAGGRDGRGHSSTENSCAAGNEPIYGANCSN